MNGIAHRGTKGFIVHRCARSAHHGKATGQEVLCGQTVQGWDKLALGEISRSTEDDRHAGLSGQLQAQALAQWIFKYA